MASKLLARRSRKFPGTRAITALLLREMSTTYGKSPGGYIWAVLEPVAAVSLLSIVFSFAFRKPPIGNDFALFYGTGFMPFVLYNDVARKIGLSIRFSKQLLAYPSVNFVDAILSRFILNYLTQAMVAFVFMTGLIVLVDANVILDWGAIAQAMSMAAALALGLGVMNCFLIHMYPVWDQIWTIINRPAFILSGVLFVIDDISEPYRSILLYNPIAHIVMQFRAGFFVTYDAVHVSQTYVYTISIICMFFGLLLLSRYNRYILNEAP
ncbi:capsular polysaccharide transport system permease protein [Primorskyibacter sedentarius]|uniref:Capsular polysaccharide transport system permease protein n=1 Tax=Primorskyibacter sedentarius TaxID=745311 RepID=A0A4R3JH73_9RHOB|nr:ABC transporter permease [Primorskyibacter sedentarius]TCS65307.1 capsular polysaccharide transport system permease protein [Primorskyibacter sedentarius]